MNNQSEKEKLNSSAAEPLEPEELAHYDDTVIGRALRWSITALITDCHCGLAQVYFLNRKGKKLPSQVTQLTAPAAREARSRATSGGEIQRYHRRRQGLHSVHQQRRLWG